MPPLRNKKWTKTNEDIDMPINQVIIYLCHMELSVMRMMQLFDANHMTLYWLSIGLSSHDTVHVLFFSAKFLPCY